MSSIAIPRSTVSSKKRVQFRTNDDDNDDDNFDADADVDDKASASTSRVNKRVRVDAAAPDNSVEVPDERSLREQAVAARRKKRDLCIDDVADPYVTHEDAETGRRVIDIVHGEHLPALGDDDDDDDRGRDAKPYVIDGKAVAIEPFHLEKERKRGYFDEDGSFVPHQKQADAVEQDPVTGLPTVKKPKRRGDGDDDDDDSAQTSDDDDDDEKKKDAWLNEVEQWSKEDADAKFAAVARVHEQQLKRMAEAEAAPEIDVDDSARRLMAMLQGSADDSDGGETVCAAMQRMRPPKRERRQAPPSDEEKLASRLALQELNALTELTSALVSVGFVDVYDAGKDEIEAWLARHNRTKAAAAAAAAQQRKGDDLVWHYRVSVSAREIHGPFTTAQMSEWYKGGFFSSPDVLVRVRHRDDERTGFLPADRIEWAKHGC
jgi:hypothetical protein